MTLLNRFLILSGIAATVILLSSVLISGFLHPGYSHLSQAIRELGARGMPYKEILNFTGIVPAGSLAPLFMAFGQRGNTQSHSFICP